MAVSESGATPAGEAQQRPRGNSVPGEDAGVARLAPGHDLEAAGCEYAVAHATLLDHGGGGRRGQRGAGDDRVADAPTPAVAVEDGRDRVCAESVGARAGGLPAESPSPVR